MSVTRKLFTRHIKQMKWQRKLSSSPLGSEEFVIKSPLPDTVIPEGRIFERLWIDADSFQNHVAFECGETKSSYTYKQLQKYIDVFATSLLKKLGLKQRDVVAVMLPNSLEFPIAAFGTLQAGCVLTTLNPIYKEFEVTHQLTMTQAKVVITVPECYETVVKSIKTSKLSANIVLIDNPNSHVPDGAKRFSELALKGEVDYNLLDKITMKPDDTAMIPFSSGTTGLPKGVEISYRNVLAAMEIMTVIENCYPNLTHGDYQDVLPSILPFFHIYGLVVSLLGHLRCGVKFITMPKFSTGLFFDILKTQNVSLLNIVPPIAILLAKHPDVKPVFFKNMRHICCGAAPLSHTDTMNLYEKAQKNFEFHQGYGATETTSLTTASLIGAKPLDFSASGVPMSNVRLKFVDPLTNKSVPVGETGEMYVSSPTVMKGYLKNEQATKETITEDGYFKTGDLGYYQPEKGLFITDRIKELIKVKGMQVAPAELEGVLRSHPSVQDAAVIGVPHDFNGETPKAFVVPKKDNKPTPGELKDFVANKVAEFKKIEHLVFVEEIPKTASGKILRKDLKKMYS